MSARRSITQVFLELSDEQLATPQALGRLYPVVYDELRRLARSLMRSQPAGHTLSPTALVHEAYLRLVDQTQLPASSRARFFCVAAKAMRSILVDHARRRGAQKRGGGWQQVTLDGIADPREAAVDVLALHDALEALAANDERMARIVELRVFAGLTVAEAAEALEISKRTVDSDWQVAKAWLSDRLAREAET